MRAYWLMGAAPVLVAAACSSNVTTATGASGAQAGAAQSGTSAGSASAGSGGASAAAATGSSAGGATASGAGGGACKPIAHDDCASDSDCPGGHCVAVTPGGFKSCQTPPVVQTQCKTQQDQCCADKPCSPPSQCLLTAVSCGGAFMPQHNACQTDACKSDGDCVQNQFENQICAAGGLLGLEVASCMSAACRTDADCKAEPCGVCAPVQNPCCNAVLGLYCVYPSNGCRSNADCKGMAKSCIIAKDQSRAQCSPNPPLCPG